ncbi:amino acid ABC transporter permease [Shinella yambaruensis]|uniref:ABC transporter permease n=1 Tax=Shinella yambaruensis TaxID=415996 RepID=A0ABQ5ZL92_9HYPH|nr:amino acid ABC transporter permease [Shinella yambaruensis]MCJ8026271.1 amino acid ABC transporter permease [Shinella yambaruensis]MCU7981678.1 amino acid ABC transporter permease [Shinella yambaruensis]GLR53623.1 ABC transporter permease [Shinella yambaruensis]
MLTVRDFGFNEFFFLLTGLWWTIGLSLVAFAGGVPGGLAIALARVANGPLRRYFAKGVIELFQGTPLLMQLFLVYFGLGLLGFELSPWTAAAIAFTLHASAFLGEIWRGCIEAVPKGQTEAATALALSYWTRMRYVILPQAFRISLPATVGFFVQLIKGTSLAAIIGFTELARAGQIISNATWQPLLVYTVVGAIYFALCWPLSRYSKHLESKYALADR